MTQVAYSQCGYTGPYAWETEELCTVDDGTRTRGWIDVVE